MKNKKMIYFYTFIIGILLMVFNNTIFAVEKDTPEDVLDVSEEKQCLGWGEKEVYLTFDDAPGDKITEKILKELKNCGIKGTFFIVGNRIKGREKVLKQIVNEGHSIGLHSYTHKFKKIYSRPKAFIDEMVSTSDEIYNVVGIRTYLLRFPGGSKPFMNKDLLQQLHSYKFKIYDWNVPVSDGIDARCSPERFYKEAIKTRKFKSPLIILMHCSGENQNTVEALPQIIDYYKKLGYNFKTLTVDSPEYYFRVKN
ncbi:MAG: polysaccharide deacetylase [Clostridiaceae bacterium]|nr:polysaccharide deacetylase [Clostridiaceae bacterium]